MEIDGIGTSANAQNQNYVRKDWRPWRKTGKLSCLASLDQTGGEAHSDFKTSKNKNLQGLVINKHSKEIYIHLYVYDPSIGNHF